MGNTRFMDETAPAPDDRKETPPATGSQPVGTAAGSPGDRAHHRLLFRPGRKAELVVLANALVEPGSCWWGWLGRAPSPLSPTSCRCGGGGCVGNGCSPGLIWLGPRAGVLRTQRRVATPSSASGSSRRAHGKGVRGATGAIVVRVGPGAVDEDRRGAGGEGHDRQGWVRAALGRQHAAVDDAAGWERRRCAARRRRRRGLGRPAIRHPPTRCAYRSMVMVVRHRPPGGCPP